MEDITKWYNHQEDMRICKKWEKRKYGNRKVDDIIFQTGNKTAKLFFDEDSLKALNIWTVLSESLLGIEETSRGK